MYCTVSKISCVFTFPALFHNKFCQSVLYTPWLIVTDIITVPANALAQPYYSYKSFASQVKLSPWYPLFFSSFFISKLPCHDVYSR